MRVMRPRLGQDREEECDWKSEDIAAYVRYSVERHVGHRSYRSKGGVCDDRTGSLRIAVLKHERFSRIAACFWTGKETASKDFRGLDGNLDLQRPHIGGTRHLFFELPYVIELSVLKVLL
ncbi:hypothetical protein RB195_026260 [Necator americanus]|uniref:Uncharacterized protein n=1 Tax=Necator americanus TaxID=51031 RepID=A0ABR1EWF7_NECAM